MAAPANAKRARPAALEAAVTTVTIPGLGKPNGVFVLADGTRIKLSAAPEMQSFILHPRGGCPPSLARLTRKGLRMGKAPKLASTTLWA